MNNVTCNKFVFASRPGSSDLIKQRLIYNRLIICLCKIKRIRKLKLLRVDKILRWASDPLKGV